MVFTNPADPEGSRLVVTEGHFTLPAGVVTLYIRAAVVADNLYEGRESFSVTAGFVDTDLQFQDPSGTDPTPRPGARVTSDLIVSDEGTGVIQGPGGQTSAGIDERPTLSVTAPANVSEGSPSVFTLSLSTPSKLPVEIDLALSHVSTEAGDMGPAIDVFTDPANPGGSQLAVVSGRIVLPAGVTTVFARVDTATDHVYEGSESFSLTAGFASAELRYADPTGHGSTLRSGAAATATTLVTDDATGTTAIENGMKTSHD